MEIRREAGKIERLKCDWIGNKKSAFTTIGANGHAKYERAAHDYYATQPYAVELLLKEERFVNTIWEPACGEGHISKVLKAHGYKVISTDLIDRGFGGHKPLDFFACKEPILSDEAFDIVTNPPYTYSQAFVEKALEMVADGRKVAMFLKLTFLESARRKPFFLKYPPRTVYVSSNRLACGRNGVFDPRLRAIAYAWYVWIKGFKGDPIIRWIN